MRPHGSRRRKRLLTMKIRHPIPDCRRASNPAWSLSESQLSEKPGVSMKAILCSQYCQPEDLVLADVPDPVAGPGEAVIAIKAAALNFFDILMIQGRYQIKPPF